MTNEICSVCGAAGLHNCPTPPSPAFTNDELLAVIRAQHEAIDWLFAALALRDRNFFPSKSPIWSAAELGSDVLRRSRT